MVVITTYQINCITLTVTFKDICVLLLYLYCCYDHFCVAKVENILLKEDGNYVLCDYGSCSLETLIPEV